MVTCKKCGRYSRSIEICSQCKQKVYVKKYPKTPEQKMRDKVYQKAYRLRKKQEKLE